MVKIRLCLLVVLLMVVSCLPAWGIDTTVFGRKKEVNVRLGIDLPGPVKVGGQVLTMWNKDLFSAQSRESLAGGYVHYVINPKRGWNIRGLIGGQFAVPTRTNGILYGPEAGIELDLIEDLSLQALYQYRFYDGSIERQFNDKHCLLLALKYKR